MRFVRRGHSTTLARLARLTGPLALAALLFAAPTAGCSTATVANDADAGPADSGTTEITGPTTAGDPAVLAGAFQLRVVAPIAASGSTAAVPGTASLVGKVYDGASPSEIQWVTSATDGACKLVVPKVPFCSTPCGGGKACVSDETCQSYPTAKSAGTVKVEGVRAETGETSFTMAPIANAYQPPAGTKLAYPPFAENDTITSRPEAPISSLSPSRPKA